MLNNLIEELYFKFNDLASLKPDNIKNKDTLFEKIISDDFIHNLNPNRYAFYLEFLKGLKDPDMLKNIIYEANLVKKFMEKDASLINKIVNKLSLLYNLHINDALIEDDELYKKTKNKIINYENDNLIKKLNKMIITDDDKKNNKKINKIIEDTFKTDLIGGADNKVNNTQEKIDNTQEQIDNTQEQFDTTSQKFDNTQEKFDNTQEQFDNTSQQFDNTYQQFDNTQEQFDNRENINSKYYNIIDKNKQNKNVKNNRNKENNKSDKSDAYNVLKSKMNEKKKNIDDIKKNNENNKKNTISNVKKIKDNFIENSNLYSFKNKLSNILASDSINSKLKAEKLKDVIDEIENNELISINSLKINKEDKLIFIGICFIIRLICHGIIDWALNTNYITTFTQSYILYVILYSIFILLIIAIVNITYRYPLYELYSKHGIASYIASTLYFFYLTPGYIYQSSIRFIVHFGIIIFITSITLMIKAKQPDEDILLNYNYNERKRIREILSNFTLLLWLFTSIIAMYMF